MRGANENTRRTTSVLCSYAELRLFFQSAVGEFIAVGKGMMVARTIGSVYLY